MADGLNSDSSRQFYIDRLSEVERPQGLASFDSNGISLDSGEMINVNHPDLRDAFQSWATMDEVPAYYKEKVIENNGRFYFYGWDFSDMWIYGAYPELQKRADNPEEWPNPRHNPMELTWDEWRGTGYSEKDSTQGTFYSDHGTHVSGIAVGRNTNGNGILGVAPEAKLRVYRNGSVYGAFAMSSLLASIDKSVEEGADVVNQSSGASENEPHTISDLAICNAALSYNVLYMKSAGNSGPGLHTSSGSAPLVFTVGSMDFSFMRNVTLQMGAESKVTRLYYGSPGAEFAENANGTWNYSYDNLDQNADGTLDFFVLPKAGGADSEAAGWLGRKIGTGAAADWEDLSDTQKAEMKGKVVVVTRGEVFIETAALAKQYGAGAVLLLDYENGDKNIHNFVSDERNYAPMFMVEGYDDAISVFAALEANGFKGVIADYEEIYSDAPLAEYSSRGPIAETYEVKPDIVTPGSAILSTVPEFMNWGDGLFAPPADSDGSDESYAKYGRKIMSGTSMAAPYMAGMAALMLGEELADGDGVSEMKSYEAMARFMNTASAEQFPDDAEYSVYDIGAGHANLMDAIKADSYVNVWKTDVPVRVGGYGSDEYSYVVGRVASYSFGFAQVGETYGRTLKSTLYNEGATKTYDVSVEWNPENLERGVRAKNASVNVLAPASVSVGAGTNETPASSDFDVSISVADGLTEADAGSYEGYIVLTNGAEALRLPFALQALPTPPSMDGDYFDVLRFNNNVLTVNKGARQNESSQYVAMHYEISQNILDITTGNRLMKLTNDLYKMNELGEKGELVLKNATAEIDLSNKNLETTYWDRIATDISEINNANLESGYYIFESKIYDMFGSVVQTKDHEFFIDNDAPVVNSLVKDLPGLKITGNVSDAGMADAMSEGFTYTIADVMSPLRDPAMPVRYEEPTYEDNLSVIAVYYDWKYGPVVGEGGVGSGGFVYKRGTVEPNGDFTIDLSGGWHNGVLGQYDQELSEAPGETPDFTEDTEITVFVIDHFTDRLSFETDPWYGFNPDSYSFTLIDDRDDDYDRPYPQYYGDLGANKTRIDTIMGTAGIPVVVDEILPEGQLGIGFMANLLARSDEPVTWEITEGVLPAGLTLDEKTGTISGIVDPDMEIDEWGSFYDFTVVATNSKGSSEPYSTWITIMPADKDPDAKYIGIFFPNRNVIAAKSDSLQNVYSQRSELFLEILQYRISDDYEFGVGYSNEITSVVVSEAPDIMITEIPQGVLGMPYAAELFATGEDFTWMITEGKLPEGLSFSGGVISGTPKESGSFTFTVTAANAAGSGSQEYTLVIADVPTGEIALRGKAMSWETFDENPALELFLKNGAEFVIAHDDPVKSVEYFVSGGAVAVGDVDALDWQTYGGSIALTEPGEYYIYARLTDTAGAQSVLNTC